MMCVGIVWLELDRSFVFARGSGQIDFAKEEHFSQRRVCFSQIGIKTESFEGGLFRFRTRLVPVRASIKRSQNIGGRKTRVSERIIWIARDRLLVEGDCFRNVVARPLSPKRSAFVVKLVGGCVARRLRRHHPFFRASELRLQSV